MALPKLIDVGDDAIRDGLLVPVPILPVPAAINENDVQHEQGEKGRTYSDIFRHPVAVYE